jgi:hypothetical protein
LIGRQLKRDVVIDEKNNTFLNEIVDGKKKKLKYRRWLYNTLKCGNEKLFDCEEEKYKFKGKYPGCGLNAKIHKPNHNDIYIYIFA